MAWTPDTDDVVYQDSYDALVAAEAQTFILTGLAVTEAGTPNRTVNIAAGTYYIDGDKYTISADSFDFTTEIDTNLSATELEFVILHINTSGVIAYTAGIYVTSNPKAPSLPASVCPIARIQLSYATNVQDAEIFDTNRILKPLIKVDGGGTGLDTVAADMILYTSSLDTFVATSITAFGRSLIDDANAAAGRTTLGLGSIATQSAGSVTITGGSFTGLTSLVAVNAIDLGSFNFRALSLESDIATGTAPIVVASTTVVANLNVDQVDGFDMDQAVLIASSPTFAGLALTGAMTTTNSTVVSNLNADRVDGFHMDQNVLIGSSPTFVRPTFSQTTGSSPMIITSTTVVTNLNADTVRGFALDQNVLIASTPTFAGLILGAGSITGTSVDISNVELQQLSLIGGNTISAAQWGYLGVFDQNLRTTDNIKFNRVTIEGGTVDPYLDGNSNGLAVELGTGSFHPNDDGINDCGYSGKRWDDIWATNNVIQTSMRENKKEIKNLENRNSGFMAIKSKKFKWKVSQSKDRSEQIGFVAEDVAPHFPEVIKFDDDGETILGLKQGAMLPILWEIVQKLQEEINQLKGL